MRIQNWPIVLGFAVIIAFSAALSATAQDKPKQPAPAAKQAAPSALQQYPVPPAEQLVLLIRLSLLTLNDAIQTGNYSVLRDRGGPSFRQANTAARLARIFTNLEAQHADLAGVATIMPQLSEAQVIGPEQRLHVKGHFPTKPAQINFELIYEPVDGLWQLFGLSVGAVPMQTAVTPDPVAAAAAPPAKSEKQKPASKK